MKGNVLKHRKRLAAIIALPVLVFSLVAGLFVTTQSANAASKWKDIKTHTSKQTFQQFPSNKTLTFTRVQEKGKYRRAAIRLRGYWQEYDRNTNPVGKMKRATGDFTVHGELRLMCNPKSRTNEPPQVMATTGSSTKSAGKKSYTVTFYTPQINKSQLKGCRAVYAVFVGEGYPKGYLNYINAARS